MELVLVNTLPKYGIDYYTDSIVHMLRQYGKLQFNELTIIQNPIYGSVWDKLRIFELCKEEKNYLYVDLDVIIRDKISPLWRDELTLLYAWWRPPFHTPLNSSIMSWKGDYSHIYEKFKTKSDYFMMKYSGIDSYINENFSVEKYDPFCTSYAWHGWDPKWPVILFNQNFDKMKEKGPWSRFLPYESETNMDLFTRII